MSEHTVVFEPAGLSVKAPTGALLADVARQAGLPISQPCGFQGRCGRCVAQVTSGVARSRSNLCLTPKDIANGFVLTCQSVVESDLTVVVPKQDRLERRLTADRTVSDVAVPASYDYRFSQTLQRVSLTLSPPSLEDQRDDWSRFQTALRNEIGITGLQASLPQLQQLGVTLREADWQVTAVLDIPQEELGKPVEARLVALVPGTKTNEPLWGASIDIGTTTVTLWLVDLITGQVRAQVSEYNRQISRGEDVISRIMYSSKPGGGEDLRNLVVESINTLLATACKRVKANSRDVVKATIAGNSTMIHLLLGMPTQTIRLAPFITGINHVPSLTARDLGLNFHPDAPVDCLPGVASYVGSDITSGAYYSGMDETEKLTLFMDVGTNGEIVLGMRDWLVACACSAGPAFEGAGVRDGMRATQGAIEEIWVADANAPYPYEPTYRVIGNVKPQGICGSGLLSLLAELFLAGIIDKSGKINPAVQSPRVRAGEHGYEYVVAWADQTASGRDIVFTRIDIDNLLRAKAAIYAGFTVLAESVGVSLDLVDQVLIGGSFGKYINIEKAIQIGLLPDMTWDKYQFLGNTSVRGAYYALLDRNARRRITEVAKRMTYLELSADNSFYEAFVSSLFLPHTDLFRFPSVALAIDNNLKGKPCIS